MPVGYADAGTATAVGYDAGSLLAGQVGAGTATAVGYAALGIPAPVGPADVPDGLRLEITTADGTQLVPDLKRRNLNFLVEHNGAGSVSFDVDLDALPAGVEFDPDNPNNLARVHFGDLASWPFGVAEAVPTSAPPTQDDKGNWSMQVAGTGSWDVLDFGLLWPPAGATGDTRDFNYNAGVTRDVTRWLTPIGRKVKQSFRWANRYPRGWPESSAQWVWSSSPETRSATGKRRFVGQFTISVGRYVRFYVAGDDDLVLYLNGAKIKSKRYGAWHTTTAFTRLLPAGTYVITAAVNNTAQGNKKAGFLCAVARLNADGERVEWLLRSNPSTFKYLSQASVAAPPDGWYPAAVLYQQVQEAAARGVDFHAGITPTFDTTKDSSGSAWTNKGPVEYDLGISGAELGEKIRALGIDAAMLPGLRLSAWKSRGFDLSSRVVISKPGNVSWSSRAWPRVRTVGLTHQEQGWTETATDDTATTAAFGRRELALSGGGVDGDVQADVFAKSAMTTAASPEETIEVALSSADMVGEHAQPVPFGDFNVADTVLFQTRGGYQRVKVMSIAGAEQDSGEVKFTIAGYPV